MKSNAWEKDGKEREREREEREKSDSGRRTRENYTQKRKEEGRAGS